ncbi:hypothetical protein BURPS668_3573 [Burkholderia pseudomallei 668]|nr:hypothetical protein BURPS668_3573 [Burkholderia pseudomallei 668]
MKAARGFVVIEPCAAQCAPRVDRTSCLRPPGQVRHAGLRGCVRDAPRIAAAHRGAPVVGIVIGRLRSDAV